MKIVFMGTPEFAVPSLNLLYHADLIDIIAVITQPDKPAGRGNKLKPSPIKQFALEKDLPVYQPVKIKKDKELIKFLKSCNADAFVTVAFGQILSQEILDIPKLGSINLHASLLPEYRGPNPIQWAIINGDTKTGVTTMLTELGVDCGDILVKHEIPIPIDTNAIKLAETMSNIGARVLTDTLIGLYQGTIKPQPQDHNLATKAPKLNKDSGNINWTDKTINIHNLIRGTKPWPAAFTYFNDKILKIHSSSIPDFSDDTNNLKPGSIYKITKKAIQVYTSNGIIDILTVQPQNKPVMKATDWARGAHLSEGDFFKNLIIKSSV